MTDLVLRDIDPDLADRIKRLAAARGWAMHDTLRILLEQGLYRLRDGHGRALQRSRVDGAAGRRSRRWKTSRTTRASG